MTEYELKFGQKIRLKNGAFSIIDHTVNSEIGPISSADIRQEDPLTLYGFGTLQHELVDSVLPDEPLSFEQVLEGIRRGWKSFHGQDLPENLVETLRKYYEESGK